MEERAFARARTELGEASDDVARVQLVERRVARPHPRGERVELRGRAEIELPGEQEDPIVDVTLESSPSLDRFSGELDVEGLVVRESDRA